jgi:cytochrome oxidase Cu insertion factor (SCO1/SenC/PrrC family)
MNGRDILSWLLALTIVGAIVAGAFVTLAALRPDPETFEFQATDVTGVTWGRDFHLTGSDGKPHELADFRGKVVALDPSGRLRLVARPETTAASIARDMRALLRG